MLSKTQRRNMAAAIISAMRPGAVEVGEEASLDDIYRYLANGADDDELEHEYNKWLLRNNPEIDK